MCDIYKRLRNQIFSTTGCKVNDQAISMVLAWQAARAQQSGSGEAVIQAHMAGQSDAGADPSYSNAKAYAATTPKPADSWIKCSERLPNEADADCEGVVWVADGEIVYSGFYGHVERDDSHFWMPTGLKRPNPPEQGAE